MNDLQKAADATRGLAKQYKAVMAIAEVLEELGSVDAATKEANRHYKKALADKEEAEEQYRKAWTRLNDLDSKLNVKEKQLKAASDKAASIVDTAVSKAKQDMQQIKSNMEKEQELHNKKMAASENEYKKRLEAWSREELAVRAEIEVFNRELKILKEKLGF